MPFFEINHVDSLFLEGSVPWTRLPELHQLAKPYYDTYYAHPSWPMVTYNFILHDVNGLWNRVKRPGKDERHQYKFEQAQAVEDQGGLGVFGGIKD